MKTNAKTLLVGAILALVSIVLFIVNWWNFIPFSEWILFMTPVTMLSAGMLIGHGFNYKKIRDNLYEVGDLPEGATFTISKVIVGDETESGTRIFLAHMKDFGYFIISIHNSYFETGKVNSSFEKESYVKHDYNLYRKK